MIDLTELAAEALAVADRVEGQVRAEAVRMRDDITADYSEGA